MLTMKDADFTFQDAAKNRRQVAEFKEDIRRHRVQISDPNAPTKKPWKVTASVPGPAWEFTRDKDGKITMAKQLRPRPNSQDTARELVGKRYICIVEGEAIFIGGEHVEAGCKIDSYADCAFIIHGVRGKILEEYREA